MAVGQPLPAAAARSRSCFNGLSRFRAGTNRERENAPVQTYSPTLHGKCGLEDPVFTSDGGSRKHPAKIFHAHEVPEFEGETAWFEAEWVLKRGWRLIRRVNEHGQPFDV